jgi:cell division septation protein DedD
MSRSANLFGVMLVGLLELTSCQSGSPPSSKASAEGGSSPRPVPVAGKISVETVSPLRPHFAVQVAAFDQRAPAERLAATLSDEFGYQTMVAPVEMGGKTLFRVRMLVRTKDEADNLANALASQAKVRAWIDPIP